MWIWIVTFLAVIILGILLRDRFPITDKDAREHKLIQNYLLNDSPLYGYNRPKLWIHSKFEINSRKFISFLSRNSTELNQPYLFLTIQSIVNYCGQDFHICLIDDDSFSTLIPSWEYEPLSTLADPVKTELRHLAFLKILYYYGGVFVPDSFLCFRSLLPILKSAVHKPYIGEKRNRTLIKYEDCFIPSPYFMACQKDDSVLKDWIKEYETQFKEHSQQVVSSVSTLITHPQMAQKLAQESRVQVLDGQYLGIKEPTGKPIGLEELLTDNYLNLHPDAYGIYIPADEVLKRTNWQWFAYMSQEEILDSNMIIAKYIMAAAVQSINEIDKTTNKTL